MPWTETTRPHYARHCPRYASELADEEWAQIEPLLPSPNRIGRPRKTDLREVMNARLYMPPRVVHGSFCRKASHHSRRCEILLPLAR